MSCSVKCGHRGRIFFIGVILAIWLGVIDGFNYSLTWNDNLKDKVWAKAAMCLTGYLFCLFTLIGSFMIFVWVKPKLGAIFIALSCCVAGSVRFVTALIGIKDFWQDLYLDSATS